MIDRVFNIFMFCVVCFCFSFVFHLFYCGVAGKGREEGGLQGEVAVVVTAVDEVVLLQGGQHGVQLSRPTPWKRTQQPKRRASSIFPSSQHAPHHDTHATQHPSKSALCVLWTEACAQR
jgi:hypothetical protein